MTNQRAPHPNLQRMTEHNKHALAYYRKACNILAMPLTQRRAAIGLPDFYVVNPPDTISKRRGKRKQ